MYRISLNKRLGVYFLKNPFGLRHLNEAGIYLRPAFIYYSLLASTPNSRAATSFDFFFADSTILT